LVVASGEQHVQLEAVSSQELEALSCSATEFGCKRLSKPHALDFDDGLDVTMPLATPRQWPETPSECWPPTPVDNVCNVAVGAPVYLESWGVAPTTYSATFMAPPLEEAPWLWQTFVPPPLASPGVGEWSVSDAQFLDLCTPPTCDNGEMGVVQTPPSVLQVVDTVLEPELGTEDCPTVGSLNHRFGTCRPCAFLHKQGCGNGVNCQFCHLCDAGEKKRRQKAKKMQLQNQMREMETTA